MEVSKYVLIFLKERKKEGGKEGGKEERQEGRKNAPTKYLTF